MSKYPTLEDLQIDEIFTAQECKQLRERNALYTTDKCDDTSSVANKTEGSFVGTGLRYYLNEGGDLLCTEQQNIDPSIDVPQCENRDISVAFDHSADHIPVSAQVIPESKIYADKHGVRKVYICKDSKGKMGIQYRIIDDGVFVSFVLVDSPAASAGIKFGDQILELNNEYLTGKSESEIAKIIKHAPAKKTPIILRQRPYEKTVSLFKDSLGKVGFTARDGCIEDLVQGSSAARNGLLTNHQIVEINGMNVIGLDDKAIQRVIEAIPEKVTIKTIPKPLYKTLVKKLGHEKMKRDMNRKESDY